MGARHVTGGLKQRLSRMVFRMFGFRSFLLPSSRIDWSTVGDGTGSSTVMAPLLWIARTFPEAPAALWRQLENGQEEQVRDHRFLRLLARPNAYMAGPSLWMATLVDWNVDGNAYWLKLRDGAGAVTELWWVPSWMIEPRGGTDVYVSHYDYMPWGNVRQPIKLGTDDVVHFRFGMDRDDPKKGYSPLKSVLREVFTDDEAANFTAAILRNLGVPGLVVSPEGPISEELALATDARIKERFAGDRRGEPLTFRGPTKIQQFGFSPDQLLLKDLRRIPEERVSAVLGVPAIVAGLGAGLDRSTFTNYSEAREAAYEQNIIPSQRILAEDLRFQLLDDFLYGQDGAVHGWRVGFDLTKVRVLLGAEDIRRRMLLAEFNGGVITRAQYRRDTGRPVTAADNVYLQPLHSVLMPADQVIAAPDEAATRTPGQETPVGTGNGSVGGNGNGGGREQSAAIAAEVQRQLQAQGAS